MTFGCSLLQRSLQQADLLDDLATVVTQRHSRPPSFHKPTCVEQGAVIWGCLREKMGVGDLGSGVGHTRVEQNMLHLSHVKFDVMVWGFKPAIFHSQAPLF